MEEHCRVSFPSTKCPIFLFRIRLPRHLLGDAVGRLIAVSCHQMAFWDFLSTLISQVSSQDLNCLFLRLTCWHKSFEFPKHVGRFCVCDGTCTDIDGESLAKDATQIQKRILSRMPPSRLGDKGRSGAEETCVGS